MGEHSNESFENACSRAATAIVEADFLLLSIGAGFSADSGLAVYNDIADIPAYHELGLGYRDLCNPCWIRRDPELFYGFWGKCLNDYRDTKPHAGYNIIHKWKQQLFSPDRHKEAAYFPNEFNTKFTKKWEKRYEIPISRDVGPFFIYSSNVDNHPVTAGFSSDELHEIHGSIETWQCEGDCVEAESCFDALDKGLLWKIPKDFRFDVDEKTMRVIDNEPDNSDLIWRQHTKCKFCDKKARPSILMFGDGGWVDEKPPSSKYEMWQQMMLKRVNAGKKLVILEIGCGTKISSVRNNDEILSFKCRDGGVSFIRVNPNPKEAGFTSYTKETAEKISIVAKGLPAILEIDKHITKMFGISNEPINE